MVHLPTPDELLARLDAYRKAHNMTYLELSELLALPISTLNRWLTTNPKRKTGLSAESYVYLYSFFAYIEDSKNEVEIEDKEE